MTHSKSKIPSDLTLGYYDKTKFTGPIKWVDVVHKLQFGIKIDDIKIGGKSTGICKGRKEGCLGFIDSGTEYHGVPKYAAQAI